MRIAVLLALVSSAANASEWWVAPSGSDTAAGTQAAPFRTIQHGADTANAGDTVWIADGTYRESVTVSRSGTASAPLLIAAAAGAHPVVKGSQLVTTWQATATAGVWRATGWTVNSQQVFVDGAPLQQIGVPSSFYAAPASDGTVMYTPVGSGLADLTPGSFWYDAANAYLYVQLSDSSDPHGHVVEASVQRRLLFMNAAYVTVRGLAFRHSATAAFEVGGATLELGDQCRLESCDVQWCDFAGVSMGYQRTGAVVASCVISNNGDSGIGASSSNGFAVRDSTISGNNYRGFNSAWHAGGVKCTTDSYGLIERCDISGNHAQGIWFDYCNGGHNEVRRCHIAGNAAAHGGGVMIEASSDVTVVDNLVSGNDRRGIYVAASDHVRVWMNTITGTLTQAAVDVSGMPRAGRTLTDVELAGNIIANNACQTDLLMVEENGTDIVDLRCDYQLFYRPGGSVALWRGLDARGGWAGTTYATLAAWQAAFGGGAHCLQADPRFATGSLVPGAGSPAIDHGVSCPGVGDDYLGNARPAGAADDIGAYEVGGAPGGTYTEASGADALGSVESNAISSPIRAAGGSGHGCGLGAGALALLALTLLAANAASWFERRR
jgi:parallel beta-helix repeat protein